MSVLDLNQTCKKGLSKTVKFALFINSFALYLFKTLRKALKLEKIQSVEVPRRLRQVKSKILLAQKIQNKLMKRM